MHHLKSGDLAPTFNTTDIYGNHITPFQDGKWTFLSFHRFAACPFCVIRTNELIQNVEKFSEHSINILSFWPSSRETMRRFSDDYQAPFPLISDEKRKIYTKYGVTKSSKLAAFRLLLHPALALKALKHKPKNEELEIDQALLPCEFLVNPDGKVVLAHYGKHYGDHLTLAALINLVKNA